MERITRSEVARKAGVSKTTVTYVLKETPGVHLSGETREKVKRIAAELGYEPDFAATSLVRGKTSIIGLLLPSQEAQFVGYYARMIAGLLDASQDTPYHFLYLGQNHPEKYIHCFARGYLDAFIVLQSRTDPTHVAAVRRFGKPGLTMNYQNDQGIPQVSMDYEAAMDAAYGILLDRGRRRIAFLCYRRACQPNIRHIERHGELARRFSDRAEIVYVEPDPYPDLAAACEARIRGGGWDGFVVDGLEASVELRRVAAAEGRRLGVDCDLVILCTEENTPKPQPGVWILEAQPHRVGMEAWSLMERILKGESVEPSVQIPFRLLSPGKES